MTTVEIASRLGVARQTVSRWLNDPAVVQAIDEQLRERRARDERRHAHMRGLAIDAMIAVLADASHRDRWRAARAVLELSARNPKTAPPEAAPVACAKCAEWEERAQKGREGLAAWLTRVQPTTGA